MARRDSPDSSTVVVWCESAKHDKPIYVQAFTRARSVMETLSPSMRARVERENRDLPDNYIDRWIPQGIHHGRPRRGPTVRLLNDQPLDRRQYQEELKKLKDAPGATLAQVSAAERERGRLSCRKCKTPLVYKPETLAHALDKAFNDGVLRLSLTGLAAIIQEQSESRRRATSVEED